jgi:hypothetical protein
MYINKAKLELQDKVALVDPDFFTAGPTTITIVNGTSTYDIPSDMEDLVRIEILRTDGKYWPLEKFQQATRERYNYDIVLSDVYAYRYIGSKIELIPTPQAAGTARIYYIKIPTDLTTDSETFDCHMGWDRWIVERVVEKFFQDEMLPDELAAAKIDRQETEAQIMRSVSCRDFHRPDKMIDVYSSPFYPYSPWYGR